MYLGLVGFWYFQCLQVEGGDEYFQREDSFDSMMLFTALNLSHVGDPCQERFPWLLPYLCHRLNNPVCHESTNPRGGINPICLISYQKIPPRQEHADDSQQEPVSMTLEPMELGMSKRIALRWSGIVPEFHHQSVSGTVILASESFPDALRMFIAGLWGHKEDGCQRTRNELCRSMASAITCCALLVNLGRGPPRPPVEISGSLGNTAQNLDM